MGRNKLYYNDKYSLIYILSKLSLCLGYEYEPIEPACAGIKINSLIVLLTIFCSHVSVTGLNNNEYQISRGIVRTLIH